MTLDKNTFPYNDDFQDTKQFYQILFVPGRAVQARELSQIQSLLQNQISKFGNHVFKEGSMVIPGEVALDTKYSYVKLQPQYLGNDISVSQFVGKKITGLTSGAVALVLEATEIEGADPNTLYLQYQTGASTQTFTGSITSGSNIVSGLTSAITGSLVVGSGLSGVGIPVNTYITEIISATQVRLSQQATVTNASVSLTAKTSAVFSNNEIIRTLETTSVSANTATTAATGYGSKFDIKTGIYYMFGYFCYIYEQSLLLDKYGSTPSYKIGIRAIEKFITESDDVSLVDPANGSPNFNAPGAHRYKIEAILTKFDLEDDTSDNFVELLRVKDGLIQKLVNRAEYSELEKTFARRTFDESGDYTVKAFPLEIKEHLNNGLNFGLYSESNGGDESKIAYVLDAGKAYVRGFEIETRSSTQLISDKPRTTAIKNNFLLAPTVGSYVFIDNLRGSFNISTLESVTLKDATTGGNTIGTARVRAIEFVSGVPGNTTARYKLYLFNIIMNTDSNGEIPFSLVRAVEGTGGTKGHCVLETGNAVLYDLFNNISIFSFPDVAIKEFTDISYATKRYLSGTMSGNSITFTAGTDEIFSPFTVSNYHLSISSASATAISNGYSNGSVVNLTTAATVTLGGSPTGKQVTLTMPTIAGSTVVLIANINKSNAVQKTKTLTSRTQSGVPHSSIVQLDRADIFRLISVIDATTSQNITERYTLDNGQRDNMYARGRLLFNTSYPAPAGNITINYEYFEHGTGDYFSVNSYDGVIDYKQISTYIASDGNLYDLINCFDFRPRENNAGNGFSVVSEFVVNGTQIQCDYEYYLGRYDRIILDSSGVFSAVTGASDIVPVLPTVPENAMLLYDVYLPPFVFDVKDIIFKTIENKRFTMRDIGRLEKRISNLEYYTQLSLLEKDTSDMFIDDGTGFNRFKNGFLVDNFSSHLVGDTLNPDYKCSIDAQLGNVRPGFAIDNVGLLLSASNSTNYTQTGELITLPFTTEVLISQPFASKSENVNPYNVFNWVGNMALTPSSDDWYETTNLPDYIITNNEEYNNALAAANQSFIWNDWETTWIGQEISRTIVQTGNSFASWLDPNRALARTNLSRLTSAYGSEVGNNLTNIGNTLINGKNVNAGYLTENIVREVGQTRTGSGTIVVNNGTREEVVEDKILSSTYVPYMREKQIQFTAKNLKPNTKVYPFFDGIPVSQYCRPNTIGAVNGDDLVSDANGTVNGIFDLPNNETNKFRTGSRDFTVMDSQTLNAVQATTSSTGTYSSTGIIQTKQQTIVSTQLFEIVQGTVEETRLATVTATEKRLLSVPHIDPLAQTFFIQNADGVFLSDIDIFFASRDTNGIPVSLQIRNVVNGVPGNQIVPFSTTTKLPSQISTSSDGQTATKFTFESPVYLQGNTEYCFVLLSNSNQYNVWCSRISEFDVFSGERISQQPYAGVLFKSANNSTWTPDQEEDIKFTINRCVFNTGVEGNVQFRNRDISLTKLPRDPFLTMSGSPLIAVNHPNHGMRTGDTVTFSGVTGTHNGIPAVELNQSFLITYIDFDTYSIEFDSNNTLPTATGITGGSAVLSTRNIRLDLTNIMAQTLEFPSTSSAWELKTRNLSGVLGSTFSSVSIRQNIEFSQPQLIINPNDEPADASVHVRSRFSTSSNFLSPVIDTSRLSMLTVSNRINNDSTGENGLAGGSAMARYITKKISLSSSAENIRVSFAAIRPEEATIKVYAKYQTDEQQTVSFDELPYVELTPIQYPAGSFTYRDYNFELENLNSFSVFAIKIVMLSSETSDVPIIKDFRAIAST